MRFALAQLNTSVGDLPGNAELILDAARRAAETGADLLVTPELATTGYPPQDLLLKDHFVTEQLELLHGRIAPALALPALVGFVDRDADGRRYNAAALIEGGSVRHVARKINLPTYDVFDEWRYFRPGEDCAPVEFRGLKLGLTICEDLWDDDYQAKVASRLVAGGARLLFNLSASPYHMGKGEERLALMRRHAYEQGTPVLYCNQVGAQDELIFDGDSLVLSAEGELVARGAQFATDLLLVDVEPAGSSLVVALAGGKPGSVDVPLGETAELAQALSLGISDYFRKCGFQRAVIGLSGGIDSAVTACLAVLSLGPENVIGVAMPSRYNSPESSRDAQMLAEALGLEFHVLPIEQSVQVAMERYRAQFGDYSHELTVENLQARERGKTLMEISNDRGALVLSTGNKTEYALGYTTLYGDMCGGLAVLGDVTKPLVYELGRWFNAMSVTAPIPEYTLTRPPSAELREGQVDPFDYDRISPLVDLAVEQHLSPAELIALGYEPAEVERVLRLVSTSEYKRKQAPPVLRVTPRSFGIGRRMPIANAYSQ